MHSCLCLYYYGTEKHWWFFSRVLNFLSSRRNWDSPTPSPAGEWAPPPGSGGKTHSLAREGMGESQFRRGDIIVVLVSRIYVLRGLIPTSSGTHRVGRVLSFFSSRRNWDSPTPSPAGECAPPPGSGGKAHSLTREGVGSPSSDERTGTRIYVLHSSIPHPLTQWNLRSGRWFQCWIKKSPFHFIFNWKSSSLRGFYVGRVQSCVLWSSEILTPHPPLQPASVSSPRTKGGGTHSPGGEGGSIFWKTRAIGLASFSLISLRFNPNILWHSGIWGAADGFSVE